NNFILLTIIYANSIVTNLAPVQNDGKEVVTSRLTPLTLGQEKLPWRSRRLGDHPGQENFPGDSDGWEKPLRGLQEGLKGKASVTSRRMKNFGVGETSGTSFVRARRIYRNMIARIVCHRSCCDMKWVVMCSPTCMVAYNTPWIIYDPVDTTNEPSSCLLPRGMRREVSHKKKRCTKSFDLCGCFSCCWCLIYHILSHFPKVYEEENMRRTYKEERNLEVQWFGALAHVYLNHEKLQDGLRWLRTFIETEANDDFNFGYDSNCKSSQDSLLVFGLRKEAVVS
ncbi:hypothetical protein HID58_059568, partial [Brassica napus]